MPQLACNARWATVLLWVSCTCFRHAESGREAVVILTNSFSPCLAHRLEAMVMSAGEHRDVWLLYAPPLKEHVKKVGKEIKGLRTAVQPSISHLGGNIHTFSGGRSKAATATFLFWLNSSVYSHAWYVETDTFYTGPWGEVFDVFPLTSGPDLVSRFVSNRTNWYWWDSCKLGRLPCNRFAHSITSWFLLRMSVGLSRRILHDLTKGTARGHHEALTFSVCKKYNFSSVDLLKSGVHGELHAGGSLYWKVNDHKNMTLSYYDVKPGTLYHPIKCQADADLGKKSLLWLRKDISENEKLRRSKSITIPPASKIISEKKNFYGSIIINY